MRKYEDTFKFQALEVPGLTSLDLIEHLIVRFNSSAVIDRQQNMYFWGDYFDGFKMKTPELVFQFEDKLADISFGLKHCLALQENGTVVSWGDGTYGELGHGRQCLIQEPREIKFFKGTARPIKVEAGARHSLVLCEDGKVYGFGYSQDGERATIMVNEHFNFPIIDIWAGASHSVAITSEGIVYTWEGATSKPKEVEEVSMRFILDVVAGMENTIFIN